MVFRHRSRADEFPDLFASLLATYAHVGEHEGDDRVHYRASFERNRLLRAHRGEMDVESLVADMQVGDMLVTQGRPTTAEQFYARAQRGAEQVGQARLAGLIGIRRASLAYGLRNGARANDRLRSALAAAPGDELIALLARMLRARAAATRGDDSALDALLEDLRARPATMPMLIHSPRIDLVGAGAHISGRGVDDVRWMDVGFWIRPDGRTADVDVLRSDGGSRWAAPILQQVTARRYAPLALEAGHPGLFRVERYTLRARWGEPTGSRIPGRVGAAVLRVADLTHLDGQEEEVQID